MAVHDSTSVLLAAAKGGPISLPFIEIPPSAVARSGDKPWFVIDTTEGPIEVTGWRGMLQCHGTQEALLARGLIAPAWLPGLPGNNRSRQTVVFDPAGPHLVLGNRRGARLDHPYLVVVRRSARTYTVELSVSPEQKAKLDAIHKQRLSEEREARERQEATCGERGPQNDTVPESQEDRARHTVRLADAMLNQLRGLAMVEHKGLTLSAESQQRILRDLAELRRAFAEARVVAMAPKCAHIGNVICWPGRGRIGQVAPAALF